MELLFIWILFSTFLLVSISLLAHLFNSLVLRPQWIRSKLQKQGINGPPPSLFLGNIPELIKISRKGSTKLVEGEQVITHDWCSSLFPFYNQWREKHGSTFYFSVANLHLLLTNNPDVVKEISTHTSFDLERSSIQRVWFEPLLGQSIINSTGEIWAHQRKIIAPHFYLDSVKGMMKMIVDSALTIANTWISKIESEGGISDIRADDYIRTYAVDVISRVCFGRNYSQGKEIFSKISAMEENLSKKNRLNGIPNIRNILPTKSNRECWKLEREIKALILKIVEERKRETPAEDDDILQRILEGAKVNESGKDENSKSRFIVDNCKGVFMAGLESSAMTATWALMLLASNPEWQNRVRAEVQEICKGELPNAYMLPKMKILTMVINETLRLYPPSSAICREAFSDIQLGDINVPKGVSVLILKTVLHQDPNIWGHDADKFNPERFANGISGACKHPHIYVPFGAGPHTCLGQHLAIAELKILLSLLLSNFTFSISPRYKHAPELKLVVVPRHGLHLLVKRL